MRISGDNSESLNNIRESFRSAICKTNQHQVQFAEFHHNLERQNSSRKHSEFRHKRLGIFSIFVEF